MTIEYDIIIVGGGLTGSGLGTAMAERGARVLVLERETRFRDRIRGEAMMPWGVAEAKELGIYEMLMSTCGHELRWWDEYVGGTQTGHRDLVATTPQQSPLVSFFHPEMQEMLIEAAASAGAEVRRGTRVRRVSPGMPPSVTIEQSGSTDEMQSRIVVGADGRRSMTRNWAGFAVRQDPEFLYVSGVLLEGISGPEDAAKIAFSPGESGAVLYPQGRTRARAYFVSSDGWESRLQGSKDVHRFIHRSGSAGMPAVLCEEAKAVGPLATFDGTDVWVDHPYDRGVALLGDAAATSDPTWGQGMSLALRDVRVLRDKLLHNEDWEIAAKAYAAEHDRYYGVLHSVTNWMADLIYAKGPEADARRGRAFPLIAQDPSRMPDTVLSGPDVEVDDTTRRRLFGEE